MPGRARTTGETEWTSSAHGSQSSAKGPADWFTGTVRIDSLFNASAPARFAEPPSRSSPVLARRGTRIRWGKRCSSSSAADSCNATAGDRRDPTWRRRLVPAWRKALAWRVAGDSDAAQGSRWAPSPHSSTCRWEFQPGARSRREPHRPSVCVSRQRRSRSCRVVRGVATASVAHCSFSVEKD